jgi:hypothetical protein
MCPVYFVTHVPGLHLDDGRFRTHPKNSSDLTASLFNLKREPTHAASDYSVFERMVQAMATRTPASPSPRSVAALS